MSRRTTLEIPKHYGDENLVPQPSKGKLEPRRDNRIFGRDIMNLITQNYSQLPPKMEKAITRPVSVQRNVATRSRRVNYSQDEKANANQSECLIYSPLLKTEKSEAEFELDCIDKEDALADPKGALVTPYVKEIYQYLRLKESINRNGSFLSNQTEVTGKMRTILIDWIVDVHARFNLVPETLFQTVQVIDRFLEIRQWSRSKLQLLGIASLFVNAKYCEIYPPALHYFSEITDRTFSKSDILDMESKILLALDFDLGRGSELAFYERYSKLSRIDEKTYNMGRYLLELALLDNKFNRYQHSMIASGALYLAQKIFKKKTPWPCAVEFQSGYTEQSVRPCAKELCMQLQAAPKLAHQAIQKKFQSPKYSEVARLHIESK